MRYSKTRIWHGGAFKLDDVHAQGSDLEATERDAEDALARETSGEAAATGSEPEPTRFYPIEELFPGHARATGEEVDAEPKGDSRARPQGLLERLRRAWLSRATTLAAPTRGERVLRGALIVAPLVVLGLIAALSYARSRERLASEEVGAASAPASDPTTSGPGPRAEASSASPMEPDEAREADAPAELTPGLERAAVDALIRGDLDEAERRYRELVRQNPAQPAFREALRILANRAPTR